VQRARQGCGSAGASPSRCRLLPESQRHWARGGGLRGWGDGGFVRLGRVSGRDEPAHQPRSGNAASTHLAPVSRAPTRTVTGVRLRAGLTGRNRKVNAARRIRGITGGRIVPRPGFRHRFVIRAIWGPGVVICELRGSSSHPRLNLPLTGEISQPKLGTIRRSGCIRKRVPRGE
jgi:hypothetical protein